MSWRVLTQGVFNHLERAYGADAREDRSLFYRCQMAKNMLTVRKKLSFDGTPTDLA